MRRWFSFILLMLAVLVGATVGALNAQAVEVDLLFVQLSVSLGVALSAALACGLLLGIGAIWLFRVLPLRSRLHRLQRQQARESSTAPSDQQQTMVLTDAHD
ncbi:MAG: hypothetical protein Tsb002_02540 [Wenzhouxiangellaceae bacterium]